MCSKRVNESQAGSVVRERARKQALHELAECINWSSTYSTDARPQIDQRAEIPTQSVEELILREAAWRAGFSIAFRAQPGPWSHMGGWFNQERAWEADSHLPIYGYKWPWHPQYLPHGHDVTSAVLEIKRALGETEQEKYFPRGDEIANAERKLASAQTGVWGHFKKWLLVVLILAAFGAAVALLAN